VVKSRFLSVLFALTTLACIGTTYAGPNALPMTVPGPIAFPCTADTACGLAHCNTQPDLEGRPYNKCAFPCADATADCQEGAVCLQGFCIPRPPDG
jgi:hypothetical protein